MPNDALTAIRPGTPAEGPRGREAAFTPGAIVAQRYRIVSPLGAGGMGEVYRADDLKLGQRVALKYVPLTDAASLQRLFAEVRIGRQISHPNVCRLYDVVEVEGQHFITMEYVDGEDLASLLRRIGRLPPDKALALARDLCAGLAAAHAAGFIHRDLKPANVMIDGRGDARITDFGLSSLAAEARPEFAGTPAYMAPEQLDGGAATIRSDIYALGLVLFEMFTGRRVFDAASLDELRAQHAAAKARPGSLVREIDPAVERIILRCLEENPAARPARVEEVLLALPGGDPLQAAVAAGETPSPEMVAAAGRTGELPLGRAWTLLAIAIALLALMVTARHERSILSRVSEVKSPEALDDRARAIVEDLGYARAPHSAGFFVTNTPYVRDAVARNVPLGPAAVPYLFRDSPAPIVPRNPYAWVGRNDPPAVVPGMTSVMLDAEGNLRELRRIAPERAGPALPPFDWSGAFRAAGLDLRDFRAAAPAFTAPVGCDARQAWVRDSDGLRVEAATAGGWPVWFAVPDGTALPLQDAPVGLAMTSSLAAMVAVVLVLAVVFARRNLANGRADRRGALRVAIFAAAATLAGLLLIARHSTFFGQEWTIVTTLAGGSLYSALVAALCYLAIEPYVRRRWPNMLVGWARLIGGRVRDPLAGSEILIGIIAGAAGTIVNAAGVVFVERFIAVTPVNPLAVASMRTPAGVVHAFLTAASTGLTHGLGVITVLVLARRALRSERAAWIAAGVLVAGAAGAGSLSGTVASTAITVALLLALRFGGVLAAITAFSVYYVSAWTPFTWSTGAWYFGRSMVTLLALAALAAWAFRTALAHKPLFGSALVEDEAGA